MYVYANWRLAGCMGFAWVHVESFLHSLACPIHSFVTNLRAPRNSFQSRRVPLRSTCVARLGEKVHPLHHVATNE